MIQSLLSPNKLTPIQKKSDTKKNSVIQCFIFFPYSFSLQKPNEKPTVFTDRSSWGLVLGLEAVASADRPLLQGGLIGHANGLL